MFIDTLAPSAFFWLLLLVVPVACVMPGFFIRQACKCALMMRLACCAAVKGSCECMVLSAFVKQLLLVGPTAYAWLLHAEE